MKSKGNIEFNATLKQINIVYKTSNKTNYYKVSYEQLVAISEKFNWVHELDECKDDQPFLETLELDKGIIDYEALYKEKCNELDELKKQLEEMKRQNLPSSSETQSRLGSKASGKTSKAKSKSVSKITIDFNEN